MRLCCITYKEAFQSGVLIAALSLEKPVIATNVGGFPEVVETLKGGCVVDSNNPISLCKAIDKASEISGDKLIKWNDDIKYKTNKLFSWDNIAKLTYNFYKELFI